MSANLVLPLLTLKTKHPGTHTNTVLRTHSMTGSGDLEDYAPLLEQDFSATGFANDLLLATNATHSELDVSTAIKRVKFDVNNINLQLELISAENHDALVQEIRKDQCAKTLFKDLAQPLDHIKTSYQRLEKDLVQPYTQATKAQDALKKIHSTSYLLRSVTYFLYLVNQIEEIQSTQSFEQTILKNPKNLIKVCNLHGQLRHHLSDNANLKSLKIIRDYEPIGFQKKQRLQDTIHSSIKSLNERNIQQEQDATLRAYFQALYTLDPAALCTAIQTLLANNVVMAVNTLTRVLTSPRTLDSALLEVLHKAQLVNKVSELLKTTRTAPNTTLLDEILQSLELSSMLSTFWRDVAKMYEVKFKETMQRGGPVAKSLISYKDQIRTLLKRTVMESGAGGFKAEGVEVRMILNSVRSLDGISRY